MASQTSRPTSDPHQIRLWAAAHDAMPAELLPGHIDAEAPQLHFFIPGDSTHQPRLRIIGWEDFLARFAAHRLSFVYEILTDGRPGRRFEILQIDTDPHANASHDSDTAVDITPHLLRPAT